MAKKLNKFYVGQWASYANLEGLIENMVQLARSILDLLYSLQNKLWSILGCTFQIDFIILFVYILISLHKINMM